MMIKDFGARVASVWEGIRPMTQKLIVSALQTVASTREPSNRASGVSYDARSDWELSRLLTALDERATEADSKLDAEQARDLHHMAETCVEVLQEQAQSAEVFAQLIERAVHSRDYARIDRLADALTARFTAPELCELARQDNPVTRALAQEALAQTPTRVLAKLLADPVDAEIARDALERQAMEFGSEDARRIVILLEQAETTEDDL